MNPHDDPRYAGPSEVSAPGFQLDPKALTVAVLAVGAAFGLWLLQKALTAMAGGAGSMIMLLLLAAGGGYLYLRARNPAQARNLEARMQQFTQHAAGRVSAAGSVVAAPAQPVAPVAWDSSSTPPFRNTSTAFPAGEALVSAALLFPSLIAYAWRYESTGFTSPWQPWWILTGLHLYFVVCVAARTRTGSSRLAAVLLGLIGTGLIGLADNPSGDVSLLAMFSSKRYYQGVHYSVPPSPDVMLWISRAPLLAILIFVAAWGIARRRPSGWALGLIPAGLLVWWAIYGSEHGFAWQGGWFQPWLLSVGAFVGGCVCCWVAELLTSAGRMTTGVPAYSPPGWAAPVSPPAPRVNPPGAHADYRDQAAQHFHGPERTYRPPGSQDGFR